MKRFPFGHPLSLTILLGQKKLEEDIDPAANARTGTPKLLFNSVRFSQYEFWLTPLERSESFREYALRLDIHFFRLQYSEPC